MCNNKVKRYHGSAQVQQQQHQQNKSTEGLEIKVI